MSSRPRFGVPHLLVGAAQGARRAADPHDRFAIDEPRGLAAATRCNSMVARMVNSTMGEALGPQGRKGVFWDCARVLLFDRHLLNGDSRRYRRSSAGGRAVQGGHGVPAEAVIDGALAHLPLATSHRRHTSPGGHLCGWPPHFVAWTPSSRPPPLSGWP